MWNTKTKLKSAFVRQKLSPIDDLNLKKIEFYKPKLKLK